MEFRRRHDWSITEIKNTLIKNRVINFDIDRIEQVIKTASGTVEKIGPPFELFEEGKRRYLHMQVTPIQVRFAIDTSILKTYYKISLEDIYFLLAEKAVTYGIDDETIREILDKEIYSQEFIIAVATPPVRGKDAIITELIPIDPDAKPLLNEDGTADYKRWENIRQIKKGEVICSRIPPTPGIAGISVFGHPLSPTPGEDRALPVGTNTKVTDDETKLIAAENGFLYRSGRDICIGSIYIIKGDVDFNTGNINYSGDVLVRGNVNGGFSVVADGSISIEGFVESSYIESKGGSVIIRGSVFGMSKATLKAANNFSAENVMDAKIIAGKKVIVKKQVRSCRIETEDLEMPGEGQLISSQVFFKGTVRVGSIGGKIESVNEFVYVEHEREQYREELQQTTELITKLSKAIEVIQTKLFAIKPNNITPELENQKKLFTSQLSACNTSKNQLIEKRKKLFRLIEVMPDKEALIAAANISPIIKVSIFSIQREFKNELARVKIGWKAGAIRIEGI